MDGEWIKWLLGMSIPVVSGVIYRLFTKISIGNKDIYTRIDQVKKDISDRVDQIKEDYVRRDDFQRNMDRQDRQFEKIEVSIQKMDEKIDRLIARK